MRQNKYGNIRQNGYASKKEYQKSQELILLKKAGEIFDWQSQAKIELRGENKTRVCNYFCDFLVIHNNGMKEYIEIKSKATKTSIWRLKWKLANDKFQKEIKKGKIKLTIEE